MFSRTLVLAAFLVATIVDIIQAIDVLERHPLIGRQP